jgi:hypothetical protein
MVDTKGIFMDNPTLTRWTGEPRRALEHPK